MLDPNSRSLLADAVRPPPGYRFGSGVALTYSLDLTTLLTVPVQLAVLGSGRREELLRDPVALLESLRRTTSRLAVVCQQGRIAVPGVPHVLYGLLEPCVLEVNAPHGGVFHPKLWLLRFEEVEGEDVTLRLVVLSRNLTPDRSWDLSLVLEGRPQGRAVAGNRPLGELLAAVPDLAAGPTTGAAREILLSLADQVRRAKWDELPAGFEEVRFHALGLDRRPWKLEPADRLAVVSPFLSAPALERLADSADSAVALISRPEELALLPAATLARFARCLTLHDQAETDDGEEAPPRGTLHGLHAKAYVAERGWYTTLALGSANATTASLVAGKNVELLVELTGRRSRVGGIDRLLGPEGMGNCLTEFAPPANPPDLSAEDRAEKLLDAARDALAAAGLMACCESAGSGPAGDTFYLNLQADRTPAAEAWGHIATVRVWPVTLPRDRAVDGAPLAAAGALRLGPVAAQSLTGFIAFELTTNLCDLAAGFVFAVPVRDMPTERDAAVLRTVIANREGFLRYLMMLLRDDGRPVAIDPLLAALGGGAAKRGRLADELPLLEELTRAFARDPRRLASIKRMVDQLLSAPGGTDLVPGEFLELWRLYESALEEAPPAQAPPAQAAPAQAGAGAGSPTDVEEGP